MKNIEQILNDAGVEVTEDQMKAISAEIGEHYRTVTDYKRQEKKLSDAEADATSLQEQLEDAQKTITGLEGQVKELSGVDAEKLNKEIADWKERAEKAEKDAADQILKRDQADFLKSKFDELGISSERTRKSLMADIMGEDGLKWKNGAFQGLDDYLKAENEKDHFYQTQEEKDAAAKQAEAEQARVKDAKPFTQHTTNQTTDSKSEKKEVPMIW